MRTVDIRKAEKEFEDQIKQLNDHSKDSESAYCKLLIACLEYCLDRLRSCPTVTEKGQEAVLMAKWEFAGDSGYYQPYFRCSHCGNEVRELTNYCSKCGACMG